MADRLTRRIQQGDTVLVVGLGKSGLSAVRFCLQQGARVKLSDANAAHPQESIDWLNSMNVEMELGGHSEAFFSNVDLVLISPGVPHRLPILEFARSQGISVCGELALTSLYLKTPVIAVTGTNGKTTTTTLIGDIVKASGKEVFVGGNIGTPLTDYLMSDQTADWVVLEVSSFQLDAAGDFCPKIGLLLNITPDHLDRYEGLEDYALSKFRMFQHQKNDDVAIYNADDSVINQLIQDPNGLRHGWAVRRSLAFGHNSIGDEKALYSQEGVHCCYVGSKNDFDLSKTAFAHFPNRENAAAAILACMAAGCDPQAIQKGLAQFSPLAHRMTLVAELNGVQYFNDSKATNVGAVEAALKAFSSPVILIAGGRDKGGEFTSLQKPVSEKVKCMLLIGEASKLMAEKFENFTRVELCASLQDAVKRAKEVALPGEVVLFSPACASFDMFKSYVHRGEVFEQIVTELAA